MSLRSEIHEALDEVTPPSPRLARRAEAFVESQTRVRPRRAAPRRWSRPLRGSLGLIAAALMLVLLAGLVLAGRYWRDLHSTPQPVHTVTLQTLEHRPLYFQTLAPGTACPKTPITLYPDLGLAVGNGPVYFIDRNPASVSSWGSWEQLKFVYAPHSPGPVLIRGWDLQSNVAVAFAQDPLGPSGITASGRVLGTEVVVDKKVQKRSEAYFRDEGRSMTPHLYPLNTVMVGLPAGASGCVGLQMDGDDFTESFVIGWSDLGL